MTMEKMMMVVMKKRMKMKRLRVRRKAWKVTAMTVMAKWSHACIQ